MIENTWEEQVERLNARVVELMHEKEALQAQLEHQMDTIGTLTKQVLWQQEEIDSLKTAPARVGTCRSSGASSYGHGKQQQLLKQETVMESTDTLQEQARAIGKKLGEIEDAKRRADNGKKVGRLFKTRNSYSCPEKPSDYWWVYAKVTKMDEHGWLYTTEFQTDKNGDINIRFGHYSYHMQNWTEIKRAEMLAAWKRLDAKLNKMAPI